MAIREQWQADIVAAEYLKATACISYVANCLYPELPMAKDREARLLEVPEMKRLSVLLARKAEKLDQELLDWKRKDDPQGIETGSR